VAKSGQGFATLMAQIDVMPVATKTWRALITFVATGAFAGYVPIIPGTAGSILGLLLVKFALGHFWTYAPTAFLMLYAVVFVAACRVADCAGRIFTEPDSSVIVLDEILGMIAAMFGNPTGWPWLVAGFTLFRLLDIIKPWPASRFDRIHSGAGVMLDDLAAACYANVTLQVLWRIL
jgi:phosphatidylglycerophosphatase A